MKNTVVWGSLARAVYSDERIVFSRELKVFRHLFLSSTNPQKHTIKIDKGEKGDAQSNYASPFSVLTTTSRKVQLCKCLKRAFNGDDLVFWGGGACGDPDFLRIFKPGDFELLGSFDVVGCGADCLAEFREAGGVS